MKANGHVFKYGDNVDTDVIIPARYLNSPDGNELAKHCMEDIDKLAKIFAELSDIEVSENSRIDMFIDQYREGLISKKDLLDLTYKELTS